MTDSHMHARFHLGVVSLTVQLDAAQADVWRHLVDPELTATWSPVVPDHALDVAGPATSREDPASPEVDATVLESRAPWVLEHRWGPDTLTWQLAPCGPGTQLNLAHELSDPAQAPDMAAGWWICLDVLRRRLAGEQAERRVGQQALAAGWGELRDRFAQEFTVQE